MINNVVLVGRVVRDPELRYTPQNTAVATFTLAVNRRFKNAQGERETDFINCVIWRQPAENLANWAKKGTLVGITGSIQVRNYENKEGQRVYVTEVLADNFQMLESSSNKTEKGKTKSQQDKDPFAGSPMEVSDDDLPF
ncbi:single-stranded DNA-binding protein [Lactococcus garvieae]|uniref:single-stranded DNA-binding protein n=1 Tax=Lactococcus garvieae TaxID=1363 RepID=UPI0013FD8B01|nr:single-stranded DNA-binding protein [Lactococcus garvieae]NHI68979.1 single-stranded DNA-binding protein [Lactococcus garvieae]NHJ07537.1 single-stranded DNA-binding protein [Lactococcus garvieae]